MNDALHATPARIGSSFHDEQERPTQVRDLQVLKGRDGVAEPGNPDMALQLGNVELQEKDLSGWVEGAAMLVVRVPLALSQGVSGHHRAVGDVVIDEVKACANRAVVLVSLAFDALADHAWPGPWCRGKFERRSHSLGNVGRHIGPLFVVVFLEQKAHVAVGSMVVAELVAVVAVVRFAVRLALAHAAVDSCSAALFGSRFCVHRVRLTLAV